LLANPIHQLAANEFAKNYGPVEKVMFVANINAISIENSSDKIEKDGLHHPLEVQCNSREETFLGSPGNASLSYL
jgi:hypothetical protein